jgi:3-isopropylmalate/(R)-2-methylmalate dehydratase small subunit
VVAGSFARIFFRNAVNQGLPLVQADLTGKVKNGDRITIDFDSSEITHPDGTTKFPRLDASVQQILEIGGLIPAVRRKLGLG